MKLPKGIKLPPGEQAIAVRASSDGKWLYVATASGKVLNFQRDGAGETRHVATMPCNTAAEAEAARQAIEAAREAAGSGTAPSAPGGKPQPSDAAFPDAPASKPRPGPKPQPNPGGNPPPPQPYTVDEWLDLAAARYDEWLVAIKAAGGRDDEEEHRCGCTHRHHLPDRCWNNADVRAVLYTNYPRVYCEVCVRIALQEHPILLKRDPIPEIFGEGDIIT